MPEPPKLAKATLQEIRWTPKGDVETKNPKGADTKPVEVQFNPQTLKVNYSNQKAGGDQVAGSPVQFVGKGTTKLALELWFDTTVEEQQGPGGKTPDVRDKTEQIYTFMKATPGTGKHKKDFVPPGVRFHWGSFLFDGVVDSMDENLEFFSSSGVPMRASVSLSISKQELSFQRGQADAEGAGTSSFEQAQAGDSVQQMAARAGNPDWKSVAAANGIENPRMLAPGALVNVSATGVSASLGGSLGVGGVSLGAASFGASVSLDAGASAVGGASFGAGGSFGGGASIGASASLSAGASFGASIGGGAAFGAGASLGLGGSAGGSVSLGAGAAASADLGGGASAGADASADISVR
jgi:hypothetical protein